jgi:3-dehydrosphinganine reductase
LDGLLDFVAYIAVPVWRTSMDKQVANHRDEHEKYLTERGFYS